MAPVVAKSSELGLVLGLGNETTLAVIRHKYPLDMDCQLTEIIAAWLQGRDQVTTSSWKSLVKALLTPTVNCPLIVQKIMKDHSSLGKSSSVSNEADLGFQVVDETDLG